jgi:hypothetical protein
LMVPVAAGEIGLIIRATLMLLKRSVAIVSVSY